jgi:flagellar basal body-associated protein FliL
MSSVTLEALRKDSDLRTQTDQQISIVWMFLPIVAVVLGIAASVLYFLTFASMFTTIYTTTNPSTIAASAVGGIALVVAVGIVAEVLYLYFFYMLIRRRNQHFPRQQRFFSDLVAILRTAAARKSVNIDATLGSIESATRQAQAEETEKSAVLWVILMLVPIVSLIAILYILYFLTGDFYKHERWEDGALSDLERALAPLGIQFVYHRSNPIPQRSYVLYLILTIITFGLFGLYWEYALIKDPNNHFTCHAVFEPQLIQLVTSLSV